MIVNKEWNCSMAKVLDTVCGKWRMNIIWVIDKNESVRYNQLKREVKGITNTSLLRDLETLIKEGMVCKLDFQEKLRHTEYYLSEKGKSLIPILKELNNWGKSIYRRKLRREHHFLLRFANNDCKMGNEWYNLFRYKTK